MIQGLTFSFRIAERQTLSDRQKSWSTTKSEIVALPLYVKKLEEGWAGSGDETPRAQAMSYGM
jgi:hypothetical protein